MEGRPVSSLGLSVERESVEGASGSPRGLREELRVVPLRPPGCPWPSLGCFFQKEALPPAWNLGCGVGSGDALGTHPTGRHFSVFEPPKSPHGCVPGWPMEGGGSPYTLIFPSFLFLSQPCFSVYLSEKTTDIRTPRFQSFPCFSLSTWLSGPPSPHMQNQGLDGMISRVSSRVRPAHVRMLRTASLPPCAPGVSAHLVARMNPPTTPALALHHAQWLAWQLALSRASPMNM